MSSQARWNGLAWDKKALGNLQASAAVRSAVMRVGESIAVDARRLAPKKTGAGAASIQARPFNGADFFEVRITWDRKRYEYMAFHEFGAPRHGIEAKAFLRSAASKNQNNPL